MGIEEKMKYVRKSGRQVRRRNLSGLKFFAFSAAARSMESKQISCSTIDNIFFHADSDWKPVVEMVVSNFSIYRIL